MVLDHKNTNGGAAMAETTPMLATVNLEESSLLRLFRCMTAAEQEKTLVTALADLGARCSFDPHWRLLGPDQTAEELADEDLDSRMAMTWPGGWPGQEIVELDNLGDPGGWLAEALGGGPVAALFSVPFLPDETAYSMAEDYLTEIREQGCPLPSDFGDHPDPSGWTDEDHEQVTAEFAAFLTHWRERILATLESQNTSTGEGAK